MKEQKYKLSDDYYFDVLRAVVERFEAYGYRPIIVGGVAVQAHIINILGIEKAIDLLRKTDDYDMVVLGIADEKIIEIMDKLGGELFEAEDRIFSINVIRNGTKKPILNVEYLNGKNELVKAVIKLNIFTRTDELDHISPEMAEVMYGEAAEIRIRSARENSELIARVLGIEDLIATKTAKGREKDERDVETLVKIAKETGMLLKWKRVEERINSIKNAEKKMEAKNRLRGFKRMMG